jgi:hypothetical protein
MHLYNRRSEEEMASKFQLLAAMLKERNDELTKQVDELQSKSGAHTRTAGPCSSLIQESELISRSL